MLGYIGEYYGFKKLESMQSVTHITSVSLTTQAKIIVFWFLVKLASVSPAV